MHGECSIAVEWSSSPPYYLLMATWVISHALYCSPFQNLVSMAVIGPKEAIETICWWTVLEAATPASFACTYGELYQCVLHGLLRHREWIDHLYHFIFTTVFTNRHTSRGHIVQVPHEFFIAFGQFHFQFWFNLYNYLKMRWLNSTTGCLGELLNRIWSPRQAGCTIPSVLAACDEWLHAKVIKLYCRLGRLVLEAAV